MVLRAERVPMAAGVGDEAAAGADPAFFADLLRGVVRRQRDIDPVVDEQLAEGWRLVPVEPTEKMGLAYLDAAKLHAAQGAENIMRFSWGGYRAMLEKQDAASRAGTDPYLTTGER